MAELRTLVEREMDRAGSPSYSFVDLARRRDRKQRNRRIGAGVVALAIAAAVGILFGRSWWSAQQAPLNEPTPSPAPTFEWQGMWPQATLEEAEKAQRQADAGDPGYAWQVPVDPSDGEGKEVGAEIATRFVEERLGWDRYRMVAGSGSEGSWDLVFIRCEPGATNPLYPDDPEGGDCAPTIDENRYETVSVRIEQPVRRGKTGIWVVTRALELLPSGQPIYDADWFSRQYEQTVPPTEAELRGFVEAFLDARVAGKGADEYLTPFPEVPLLYATSDGTSFEGSEIRRVDWGPQWPDGAFRVAGRLFADGGSVVVDQSLTVWPEDGRLVAEVDAWSTTENGQAVPLRYGLLGGGVTFEAPRPWWTPWFGGVVDGDESVFYGPARETFMIVVDPWIPVRPGCQEGSSASAREFARWIGESPELDADHPLPATVGGIEALRIDLAPSPGARTCPGQFPRHLVPVVIAHQDTPGHHPYGVAHGERMRIYLLDLPGEPGRTAAIMIDARAGDFEQAVADATPLVDSIEFHMGGGGNG